MSNYNYTTALKKKYYFTKINKKKKMKKIFLSLILCVFSVSTYGQISSSYEKGFKAGYCKGHQKVYGKYAPCPVAPVPPIPKIGKESYNDGVVYGYEFYLKKNAKAKEKKERTNNALIQGAKTAYQGYGETFQKYYTPSSSNSNSSKPRPISDNQKKLNEYNSLYRALKLQHKNELKRIKFYNRQIKFSSRKERKKALNKELAEEYNRYVKELEFLRKNRFK